MSSSLVVWTILTARKQEKLSFEELISKSAEVCGRETYFVQVLVDPESPNFGQLSELASLISSYEITHSATHVILQKISDYAKEAEASSPALLDSLCQTLEDQILLARSKRPGIRLRCLNEPQSLKTVSDRWLTKIAISRSPVSLPMPKTVLFSSSSNASTLNSIQFPARTMWKPRSACGQPDSHSMFYIPDAQSLDAFKPAKLSDSGIIQQFIPHHQVLYKVYVLGNQIAVDLRPSLGPTNFTSETCGHSFTPFDGEFIRVLEALSEENKQSAFQRLNPLWHAVKKASRRLASHLKLSLFGWDLIISEATSQPYIIDINYFPKFDGFPNFHEHLLGLLNDEDTNGQAQQQRNRHNVRSRAKQ